METFLTNLVVKITGSKKDCEENRGEIFIVLSSQLSSGDASDSICPKGWGMGGYSGDGSYQKNIVDIYGINNNHTGAFILKMKQNNYFVLHDEIIVQVFFSSNRSGNFDYSSGSAIGRIGSGSIWTNNALGTTNASRLFHNSTYLSTKSSHIKGNGFSLRCVAK